jgi:hypothetical protein
LFLFGNVSVDDQDGVQISFAVSHHRPTAGDHGSSGFGQFANLPGPGTFFRISCSANSKENLILIGHFLETTLDSLFGRFDHPRPEGFRPGSFRSWFVFGLQGERKNRAVI